MTIQKVDTQPENESLKLPKARIIYIRGFGVLEDWLLTPISQVIEFSFVAFDIIFTGQDLAEDEGSGNAGGVLLI